MISPANTVSPNPSGVNGPNSSPTLSHTGRLSPRLPAPKTAPKETRFEDIVHVQRRDGVLETSLGSGILETSLSGGLPSTIQCEEKLPSCSSSLQSLTGATLKHEGPMRETNIILFQDTEPTDQVQDTKRDLFDFDSEGGTDL